MNRLWQWLERNSSQLQGLAAVAAILGGIAAAPFLLSRWLRPEVDIFVRADASTLPVDLETWVRETSLKLRTLPSAPKEGDDPFQRLRQLQTTGPLDAARVNSWSSFTTDRFRVDVVNQTDRVIPGVRLRLSNAYPSWGVRLAATFLTADEIREWQNGMWAESTGPVVVLPELPPLPPQSAVSVAVYGYVADADVSATIPGATFRIIEEIRVEDKWPLSVVLRPYWLPVALVLLLLAILGGLVQFEGYVMRGARRGITYDLACLEARAGRKDSALALLEEAITAGFTNFRHARTDPDLETLRDMDAFKKLVGS